MTLDHGSQVCKLPYSNLHNILHYLIVIYHGSQVDAVEMFASGGVLLSAGGTDLKVWDVLSGVSAWAKDRFS
eukprot:SAG31_NODE_576_length_13956_cov_10.311828_6_plen_72_part_00